MVVAAAGIAAVGSVAGSAISAGAAGSASKAQQAANIMALKRQDATDAFNRGNTQPYINNGLNGLGRQQDLIGSFNDQIQPLQNALVDATPGTMTQANLESTPGYQFTLSQGLKATQNAAAARGLGVSGAALRGAADYATGLSDQTYNTRFNQKQTQYQDASNNLSQTLGTNNQLFNQNQQAINIGENAAVGSGYIGQASAQNYGNTATAGGNAQGAADIAGGNALAKGIGGVGTAAQQYAATQQAQQNAGGSEYGNQGIPASNYAGTNGLAPADIYTSSSYNPGAYGSVGGYPGTGGSA